MIRIVFVSIILGFCACISFGQSSHKPFEVVAYYTGDGDYINNYQVEKLTHIIYSFLHVRGDTISFGREANRTSLRKLVALKQKFPSLKVMFAMGGWGACAPCSDVFSTVEGRRHFAESVLKVCQEYGADGIDIDWEYPAIEGYPGHAYKPEDKSNFTELLKELHQLLAPKYEFSFAAGGFTKFLENSIDWDAVFPLINRVNLMTYDLVHGYSTETGHHTPLYSNPKQVESTDNCVNWLLSRGYPSEKLVIGTAFYGRTWVNVVDENHGIYKSGKFRSFVNYRTFDKRLSPDSGWVKYWDKTSHAPYAYNSSKKEFATFDNPRSMAEKVKYAKKKKLGGIMFWELTGDQFRDGLLDAIDKAVHK